MNLSIAPPPLFINKPCFDDHEEVTDKFDTGFNADLKAIIESFVGAIFVLLT